MRSNQLIIVFLELSGTEKRAINKVVVSPFFNHRQEVIDLWNYLVKHSNEGSIAFKKEQIFKSVFPEQEFNEKKLRHVSSWLLQCIEEYLSYNVYKSTPVKKTLHLARVYKEKKQEKYFQKTLRLANEQIQKMPRGLESFYFDYSIKFENYSFLESRKRLTENNLWLMNAALDKYLLMSKLKQACIAKSHRSVFTTDYNFQLVDILLTFLEKNNFLMEPGIECYYYCYRAISENNEECFQKLIAKSQEYKAELALDDFEYLYYSAINFSITMLNIKGEGYRQQTLNLYRSGLNDGILTKGKEISRFAYNNIVSIALPLFEFEWIEKFIFEYKPLIHPQYRDSIFAYNLAKLNFDKKKYDEAMKLLLEVDERDLLVNIEAKVMLIKIYFESNEFDPLTSLLSSTTVWLSRKKMLTYHKIHYENFVRFTNRILSLKPTDSKAFNKLKTDISQESKVASKKWLLQQLD